MTRQTRAGSGAHNAYPQQLGVSLAPSPMYPQPRMSMPSNEYFNMPSSSASSSMQLAPQQQQQHQQPPPPPQQQQQPLPQTSFDTYSAATAPTVHLPQSHRPSSGAWTVHDDQQLMHARAQGLNWNQIRENYFPSKTPNACRKRHERLAERRDADDWDTRKFQRLAKEYMAMRKEIWSGLAARTGEKWNVVEQKCMSNGIKNIQSAARAASRHQSQSAAGGPLTGYDDDSGISGIGLTPGDELDASYSSPDTSSSGGAHSASSAASAGYTHNHHHHQHHHHQQQQQHHHHQPQPGHPQLQSHTHAQLQALAAGAGPATSHYLSFGLPNGSYGGAPAQHHQHHHRYSSSVSSTTSAYANGGGGTSESSSPYMNGQRLPSVDMGIGSIINRPGGGGGL